jgi:hypothetical protein
MLSQLIKNAKYFYNILFEHLFLDTEHLMSSDRYGVYNYFPQTLRNLIDSGYL